MYSHHKSFSKVFFALLFCLFLINLSHLFADPKPPDKNYFSFTKGIYVSGERVGAASGFVKNGSFTLFAEGYTKTRLTDRGGDLKVVKVTEGVIHEISGNIHTFTGTGTIGVEGSTIDFKTLVSGGQISKFNRLLSVLLTIF